MNYETMLSKAAKTETPAYIPMVSVHLVREGRMKYSVRECLKSPDILYRQFSKLFRHQMQEKLVAVFVDTQLIPLGVQIAGIGTGNSCVTDIAGIFRAAILSGAEGIFLMHNHPSGTLEPSKQDIDVTDTMIKVGEFMKIPVLDHLIMTDEYYHSLKESEDVQFPV